MGSGGTRGRSSPPRMPGWGTILGALLLVMTTATGFPAVSGTQEPLTASSSIESACRSTLYPDACTSAFASIAGNGPGKNAKELFDISVQFTMGHVHAARSLAYNLTFSGAHRAGAGAGSAAAAYPPTGAYDCVELLDDTVELLSGVLSGRRKKSDADVETWLSAALTNQVTCAESLAFRPPADRELIELQAERLRKFLSNSLALHKKTAKGKGDGFAGLGRRRRLLTAGGGDGLPSWLSASDRRLLEAHPSEIEPHAVVAQDGSGTHTSINDALAFVSLQQAGGGGGRTVIYIKAGTYSEVVRVPTKQKNVLLMGDGKGVSVIVGSRSNNGGWTTYQSAIVAGMGAGFIARDLSIINNAGPAKEQAVALRVGADRGLVYRCSIQGYQDTLYAHSNRQFYTSNDIYGTVDFIFGNAAAVFQGCNIVPRRPGAGQRNSVTAQGRRDPNQNTGFVFQSCRVGGGGLGGVPTYLGRPWHQYARVVFMQCYIDGSIHPNGWEPWSGGFALSTLYYGEYGNTGPGAGTGGRVRWPGVHSSMSAAEASKFTVASFIDGDSWLPSTGVSYKSGL